MVREDLTYKRAGTWGGGCACPNGEEYQVGKVGHTGTNKDDACEGLACIGGIELNCTKSAGEWSNREVNCGQGIIQ